jgi:hypothetical protein
MISRLQLSDPTITSYSIYATSNVSHIESLLNLCHGSAILINSSNGTDFMPISRELENSELYLIVEEYIWSESVTTENSVSRYLSHKSIGVSCVSELEFMSLHLYEIDRSKLDRLDSNDIEQVLSNKSLCICREDWLFDLIDDQGFEEFFELIGFVRFEFASIDRIVRFARRVET